MSSPRRPVGASDRIGIVGVALFAPFVLVLALIAYTVQGERTRREIESRVRHDYGAMAVVELGRQSTRELHDQVAMALRPVMHAPGPAAHDDHVRARLDPAVLLVPSPAIVDSCVVLPHIRGAFRLELPSRRLATAGPIPAALHGPLIDRIARAAAGMGDPHRVLADTLGGTPRVIAFQVFLDSASGEAVIYGVEGGPEALGAVFERVLERYPMVPSALLRPPHTSEHLRVSVRLASGGTVWSNAASVNPVSAGIDTLASVAGSLVLHVEAGDAVTSALRIGRPSPLYVPVLGALLALSATLAFVALMHLRRAREMSRMRTRFVANVSHELRTPLTQISMFAEMLSLGRDRDAQERQRYAEVIRREVTRLSTLVDGVLRFARSEEGRSMLRLEQRILAQEVRDAVDFFTPVAAGADVVLEMTSDAEPWVAVDPGALRQILLNLLDNAVKHGPRGQTVLIAVAAAGEWATIRVTDEGPGIPLADRERIFEPYARLDRPGLPRVAGAGIGLAVVRDLVTAHGGTVQVADSPRGATMVVTLPVASRPLHAAGEATREKPAATTAP